MSKECFEYTAARNCGVDTVAKLLSEGWSLIEQITHQVDWSWKKEAYETEYRFKRLKKKPRGK